MNDPKSTLDLRLAKGEISKAEYLDLLETIGIQSKALNIKEKPVIEPQTSFKNETYEPRIFSPEEIHSIYKRRCNAFAVDFIISLGLMLSFTYLSEAFDGGIEVMVFWLLLLGILYFLLKDSLPYGRSIGKRIYQLRTVQVKTQKPCGVILSFFRNLILLIILIAPMLIYVILEIIANDFFGTKPSWIISGLILACVVFPLTLSERSRIKKEPTGLKLADRITGTQVIPINSAVRKN